MGEALDTIPSILNKCLFVSPDQRTNGRTDGQTVELLYRTLLNAGAIIDRIEKNSISVKIKNYHCNQLQLKVLSARENNSSIPLASWR